MKKKNLFLSLSVLGISLVSLASCGTKKPANTTSDPVTSTPVVTTTDDPITSTPVTDPITSTPVSEQVTLSLHLDSGIQKVKVAKGEAIGTKLDDYKPEETYDKSKLFVKAKTFVNWVDSEGNEIDIVNTIVNKDMDIYPEYDELYDTTKLNEEFNGELDKEDEDILDALNEYLSVQAEWYNSFVAYYENYKDECVIYEEYKIADNGDIEGINVSDDSEIKPFLGTSVVDSVIYINWYLNYWLENKDSTISFDGTNFIFETDGDTVTIDKNGYTTDFVIFKAVYKSNKEIEESEDWLYNFYFENQLPTTTEYIASYYKNSDFYEWHAIKDGNNWESTYPLTDEQLDTYIQADILDCYDLLSKDGEVKIYRSIDYIKFNLGSTDFYFTYDGLMKMASGPNYELLIRHLDVDNDYELEITKEDFIRGFILNEYRLKPRYVSANIDSIFAEIYLKENKEFDDDGAFGYGSSFEIDYLDQYMELVGYGYGFGDHEYLKYILLDDVSYGYYKTPFGYKIDLYLGDDDASIYYDTFNNLYKFEKENPDESIELEYSFIQHYKVEFDDDRPYQILKKNTTADELYYKPIITKDGYSYLFAGFYKDSLYSEPFEAVTDDMTIYLKYERAYKIEFYTNPMSPDEATSTTFVSKLKDIKFPSLLAYPAYAFEGWYVDKDYTVPFDSNGSINSDMGLYAYYRPQTLTGIMVTGMTAKDTYTFSSVNSDSLQRDLCFEIQGSISTVETSVNDFVTVKSTTIYNAYIKFNVAAGATITYNSLNKNENTIGIYVEYKPNIGQSPTIGSLKEYNGVITMVVSNEFTNPDATYYKYVAGNTSGGSVSYTTTNDYKVIVQQLTEATLTKLEVSYN